MMPSLDGMMPQFSHGQVPKGKAKAKAKAAAVVVSKTAGMAVQLQGVPLLDHW
jgi:hypothetical protein